MFAQEIVDLTQLRVDHVVVIIPQRITSDPTFLFGFRYSVSGLGKIIQGQNDDRFRARQNLLRITTLLFAAGHITHLAVRAIVQPRDEFAGMGWGITNRDATGIKTDSLRK